MQYRNLIKQVQVNSGFSDQESETAINTFISTMAARLQQGERKDFASQLPQELQDRALAVTDNFKGGRDDFFANFMEQEGLQDEPRAKKQIMASWNALKSSISEGQIKHLRDQMPPSLMAELR